MKIRYAISGLAEARSYLAHSLLGPRLVECVEAMNRHAGGDAAEMLGSIDALKFHSSVMLYFAGVPDQATLRLAA